MGRALLPTGRRWLSAIRAEPTCPLADGGLVPYGPSPLARRPAITEPLARRPAVAECRMGRAPCSFGRPGWAPWPTAKPHTGVPEPMVGWAEPQYRRPNPIGGAQALWSASRASWPVGGRAPWPAGWALNLWGGQVPVYAYAVLRSWGRYAGYGSIASHMGIATCIAWHLWQRKAVAIGISAT